MLFPYIKSLVVSHNFSDEDKFFIWVGKAFMISSSIEAPNVLSFSLHSPPLLGNPPSYSPQCVVVIPVQAELFHIWGAFTYPVLFAENSSPLHTY